jgi:hypothetical protein
MGSKGGNDTHILQIRRARQHGKSHQGELKAAFCVQHKFEVAVKEN